MKAMPSVPVCLFLEDDNQWKEFRREYEQDLARCANGMILFLCLLADSENKKVFRSDGSIETDGSILVRRILSPYLIEILNEAAPSSKPLIIDDEYIPLWFMEIEYFVGVTESQAKSIRLCSASSRTAPDYAYFRKNAQI